MLTSWSRAMSFRLAAPILGLSHVVGDIVTREELAGRDPDWLLSSGALEPLAGPLSAIRGATARAEDLLGDVADLQAKYEAAATEAEQLRLRASELEAENESLRLANAAAVAELAEAVSKLDTMNDRLRDTLFPKTPVPVGD